MPRGGTTLKQISNLHDNNSYLQIKVTNKIMMVHYNEIRFTPVLSYSNATTSKTSLFTANSLTLINTYEIFLNKKAS